MKHIVVVFTLAALLTVPALAQQTPPEIAFESVPDFLRTSPDMNFGEVLGVAVNSVQKLLIDPSP